MDAEGSKLAEYITQTGHEINWKATERRAPCGDNTMKRKITEVINVVGEKNLMNKRLEEGKVSDNFSYCLSKLGENKNGTRPEKKETPGSRICRQPEKKGSR
ncbi:unnamed protein product [Protopolystoma xenopodis]|uniref:Uncharacterized protein n=1 Tax=Protopolystoma xenopodis TaxID=117903 RepID=A0A3S5BUM4_9PLAT|nr:unnamed protein product [Protopolystoma xenopodis]